MGYIEKRRERRLYSILHNSIIMRISVGKMGSVRLEFRYLYEEDFYKNGKTHHVNRSTSLHNKILYAINKCPICGKETEAIRGKKYCSDECYIESNRRRAKQRYQTSKLPPTIKTCPKCGNQFPSRPNQIFCSQKCRIRKPPKPPQQKKCKFCKQTFYGHPQKKYCSYKCKVENKRKNYRERWGRVPRPTLTKTCQTCNTKFTTTNRNKKYCGTDCWQRSHTRHIELPEHYNKPTTLPPRILTQHPQTHRTPKEGYPQF